MNPQITLIAALFSVASATAFAQTAPPMLQAEEAHHELSPEHRDLDHERTERAEHAERRQEVHHAIKEERRKLQHERRERHEAFKDREAALGEREREHEAREHMEH